MHSMHRHRYLLAAAARTCLLATRSAFAADAYSPPVLEPLPEIAAPPGADNGDAAAPQVTVIQRDRETVEEARVNGIIIWIKVTPRHGRPYYLIPSGGGNMYIQRYSLDTGLKVPMWTLFSW